MTRRPLWSAGGARFCAILMAPSLASILSQPGVGQVPPGQVQERVQSTTDTSQSFALFLPPGYSSERRWPVLLVLDPRRNALRGLGLFQDAAARLGWVVMSSYNTLSDSAPEPNIRALNAMLAAAQTRVSAAPGRLYLAGFSGTARVVLEAAVQLRGHVAGLIAAGAGSGWALGGPEMTFAADSTFAYFGAAGTEDFNYEEVLALGERFRTMRVPSRVVVFAGEHSWPPRDVCGDALTWLELRAMVAGLRTVDSGWVRAQLTTDLGRAGELERTGRWEEALRLDREIVRDYARWPGANEAAARVSALATSPAVSRYEGEARQLAERDYRQGTVDLPNTLAWARSQRGPPRFEDLTQRLHIGELEHSVEHGDSLEAASARRLLARLFVQLAFYEPRAYLASGEPARAVRMLEAATTIRRLEKGGEGCRLLSQALATPGAEPSTRLAGECST